jgi:dissimilatory sulfite reductase (desulfoviridin) alpha/beta subunit
MKWTNEAERAVSRVPFFVRRRVKKRVEKEAARSGAKVVDLRLVKSCQAKYLKSMDEEVKGFQVEICFGPSGCPNRAVIDDGFVGELEERLSRRNLREFLYERVDGPLKMHHEFRVCVSDCPNACSRPQICDLGLIGAVRPGITDEPCNRCLKCVETCREEAIRLRDEDGPDVDFDRCVLCGQCVTACPTGTLCKAEEGYRFLVGGKLGRHPRLAEEQEGIFSKEQAGELVERCLDHHMRHNENGERFGVVLNRTGTSFLFERKSGTSAAQAPVNDEDAAKVERLD